MPYDPRQMMQIGQLGIGMMGAPQGNPFDSPVGQRPKQWWEQPIPASRIGQSANSPNSPNSPDDGQSANPPGQAKPPSLLDMMLDLGRMTPAQYNKARQQGGGYGGAPPQASPWSWLGSMGGPR